MSKFDDSGEIKGHENRWKPEKDGVQHTPVTPEEAERMLRRVGEANRKLIRQGKNGTSFSPAVTQDPLLDVGLELLLDIQKKDEEPEN